jgi:predicted neuraminidase
LEELKRYGALRPIIPTRGGTGFDGEVLAYILLDRVLASGAEVLLHTTMVEAEGKAGRVEFVRIFNKSGLQTIRARYWVDCTGDGDLVAMAGYPTARGGDVFAPDGGKRRNIQLQLPMSLCFYMEDVGVEVRAVLPDGCPTWRDDDDLPMTTVVPISPHTVFVKMKVIGGDVTIGSSYSDAEIRARRQMMGLVYHLQTKGYRGKVYSTYKLRFVSPGLGIREGRRAVGEYVLTEEDVRKGRRFPDAVAVGTYQIDYHWPDVLQRAGTGITDMVPPYHIPIRALIPRGARNLIVAGRCASGDQMAMSSFRVMTSCAQTGFAAGLACGLATRGSVDPRDLDLPTLQKALERRGQILNTTPYRRYRRQRRMVNEVVQRSPRGECRSPTVVELDYGETLIAWSARGDDGREAIWTARRVEEDWREPTRIGEEALPYCRDPVLFRQGSGPVHLFYRAGAAPDSMATMRRISEDGARWGPGRRLAKEESTPGPTGGAPVVLSDGNWIAPSSISSGGGWLPSAEISRDDGRTWSMAGSMPMPVGWKTLESVAEPTLWESEPGVVHMLVRDGRGTAYRSDSWDGGGSWSEPCPAGLPRGSGLGLQRLEDGELAVAHRPARRRAAASGKRRYLTVSLSEDNGGKWPFTHLLQDPPGQDGILDPSDPSTCAAPEGLSIVYLTGRGNLGFCRLSVENIKGQ